MVRSATGNAASNVPVGVSGLTSTVAITAGEHHSCALIDGGGVACWGRNDLGQLGNGSNSNSNLPVEVEGVS